MASYRFSANPMPENKCPNIAVISQPQIINMVAKNRKWLIANNLSKSVNFSKYLRCFLANVNKLSSVICAMITVNFDFCYDLCR